MFRCLERGLSVFPLCRLELNCWHGAWLDTVMKVTCSWLIPAITSEHRPATWKVVAGLFWWHLRLFLYLLKLYLTRSLALTNTASFPLSVYVFCNDLCFTMQHYWLLFITETECVYCAVRTGYLYTILRSAPYSVFMCFVWISEQTAVISLYSINWLLFRTETECLLHGTDWVFIYNSTFCPTQCIYIFCVDLRTNSDYFPIQH